MKNASLLQFIVARGAGAAVLRRVAAVESRVGVSPDDILAMGACDIATTLDISRDVADNVLAAIDAASRLADALDQIGVEILWLNDDRYPERLLLTLGKDAPPVLFVKGNVDLLPRPAVGFCGSRKASSKGIEVTGRAASVLVEENICVVSGHANGVDLAAHRAAMEAGGTTVLVLVEGILRLKAKKGIEELLRADNHLFVSQFPPGLPWIATNAMKRNRTIIGLCDAMILVELGLKGGTFAAGTESLERRHPLFIIDFAHPGPSAEANPYFISRGGIPVRGNGRQIPNLVDVIEVTRHPRWREAGIGRQLF